MGVFAIAWMIALRIVEGLQRKQITQSAQPHSAEPRSAEPRYATHAG
jgi:hypothetical protein